jgi:ATP-dependent protease ClpP protease subunit
MVDILDGKTVVIADSITMKDAHAFRKMTWPYTMNFSDTATTVKELNIYISSPGGHAVALVDIYNRIIKLKEAGVKITTTISSFGYSAGAIIWLLGDERYIHEFDMVMLHYAQMYRPKDEWKPDGPHEKVPYKDLTDADKKEMKLYNDLMIRVLSQYISIEKAKKMLSKDTFLTAQEALALGLATKII